MASHYSAMLRSIRCRSGSQSGSREKLEHVSVGIFEIDTAAAVPSIDLPVIVREWTAAVGDSGLLDATEDRVDG